MNKSNVHSIINWKLPEACERFDLTNDFDEQDKISEEVIEDLISNESDIPQVVNDLLFYLLQFEATDKAIGESLKDLQARRQRFSDRIDSIKSVLKMVFR